ncbi:fatty acid desaturase [Pseudaestuariivita rosea]|uniref:fatty acid desaturase n=1 Tax=Pseudaestuariivita rosea TaxID=2763263 RepID=UPI001ABBAA75|nr:fatty acid desaturase [Pseudaestuariivita rosea]
MPLHEKLRGFEWPTLVLLFSTYLLWALATTIIYTWSPVLAVILASIAIVQFASLQHEIIHGHPFENRKLNELLVFPALTLVIPYQRFRDTHMAHHQDSILTDPYDDPESNYLDAGVWEKLPAPAKAVLNFNNCMLGRLLLGPVISQIAFMRSDLRAIRRGDRSVLIGWLWHIPAVTIVLLWITWAGMPLVWYVVAVYLGLSILKIRTFLEHQAHEKARGRTVIIEDRGPLAFLFLNNNLHVVHHMHPKVPWYRLPSLYRSNSAKYLRRNEGYRFASYTEVFRRYFWQAKDTVPHPIWRR